MVHYCHPITQEEEVGGSGIQDQQVRGQPGIHETTNKQNKYTVTKMSAVICFLKYLVRARYGDAHLESWH